jgi:hypothetical protein
VKCKNCDHAKSDHVTLVTTEGTTIACYFPIHRNFDCPCTKFERKDDLREAPHP